jgi:hypothetical protein
MASKEPPLIRSSKAFSVEIPEGSNSAKARRSDVVAGLMDEVSSKEPHFDAAPQIAPRNHTEEVDSPSSSGSFEQDKQHQDQFAGGQSDHQQNQLVGVANDAIEDKLVGVSNDALKDHLVGVANDALEDHLVSVAQEGTHDSHAHLPNSAIEDHHHSVANTAIEDRHDAGIAKEVLADLLAAIPNESVEDHIAAIPNEGVEDHVVAVPQDKVTDSHAGLPIEAIEDHHVAVQEPAEPIPLFVSADDDFPDDHMEIEAPPEVDPNEQAIENEALVDHVVPLPDNNHALVEAKLAQAPEQTPVVAKAKPAPSLKPVAPKKPTPPTPDMLKKQEEEIAAKKHRMEEFHGRVDAIRQTVSNINAKLDQMSPHEGKPPGH